MKKYLFTTAVFFFLVFGLQFCSNTNNNNEVLRTKIIEANDEIFNKKNIDYADEVFSEDFAGTGPQFIKDFAQELITAFPDLEVKTEQVAVEGNLVGWYRTNTGTHKNEYLGHPASGKKISWTEILFTRFNDEGVIVQDWYSTNVADKIKSAANVEGVYEYLPPLKGHGIIKNGNFIWLVGPSDESTPMTSQSGTYVLSNDIFKMTIIHSTEPSQVGWEFWSKTKSWDGDTLTYETMNTNGEIIGGGRALRIAD